MKLLFNQSSINLFRGDCMAEVYFYVPAGEAGNAVECGLKLSRWYDKEVCIDGCNRKCMSALLNPRDDMAKYRSSEFQCLKLDIPSKYCFVADGCLYRVGLKSSEVMKLFERSILHLENYTFGLYRHPECLITTTVLAEQISILGRKLDSPILFDNSEDLYVNNIIEIGREEHDDFNDAMLYYFFCSLAASGKIDKIEDNENKIAVFIDRRINKAYTIKIPCLDKY